MKNLTNKQEYHYQGLIQGAKRERLLFGGNKFVYIRKKKHMPLRNNNLFQKKDRHFNLTKTLFKVDKLKTKNQVKNSIQKRKKVNIVAKIFHFHHISTRNDILTQIPASDSLYSILF